MPEHNAANNILPFSTQPGSVERRQKVPAKARALLDVCRDRLAHGVAVAFAENLTPIHDNLLKLAERTTSLERQHLYFATQRFLSARSQELLEQFRGSYVRVFDETIAGGRKGSTETGFQEDGELSLVDETDFERELGIGKLTSRATYNCSQQLMPLNRRMAVLLQAPQIGQDNNPLYPAFVFDAMLDAARGLGLDEQVELTLLQQFELYTAARLPNVYKSINQFLIENDILPTIPLGRESAAGDRSVPPEPAPAPSVGTGVPQPIVPADTLEPAANESDVFTQLVDHLLGAGHSAGPGGARSMQLPAGATMASGNGLSGMPGQAGGLGYTTEPVSRSRLVGTLTDLQRGHLETVTLPGVEGDGFDPGMVHVLQQIRSAPQVSESHPVDILTLDIVALLFDVIFKDPDFPVALRAEIGKLQIPMLKVALMDKGFFANRLHPARKLLDMMAGAAVGWHDNDQSRLLGEIRDIIDRLIANFDSDIGVFTEQVERLEAFLAVEERQAAKNTEAITTEMEKRDRKEAALRTVESEINRRLHRLGMADEVADFLKDSWRLVLIHNLLHGGPDNDAWTGVLQTMDDLIWSVAPKQSSEERNRLMAMLPDLLERLRAGLGSVSLEGGWQEFFTVLIRLHMETLHAPPGSEPEAGEAGPAVADAESASIESDAAPTMAEDAPMSSSDGADDAEQDRYMELAKGLEVGSWVEFRTKRGKQSLRLSWVSGMRGVYLFTNRNGMNALSVAVTRLADHLRKGAARLHRPDDLTERAVKSLLGQPSGKA